MEEQTRIKICGLTRLEDIDAVNELKPEYVGFVFAKSRRQITKEHAVTLRRYLDPEIQAVGVFVTSFRRLSQDTSKRASSIWHSSTEMRVKNISIRSGSAPAGN